MDEQDSTQVETTKESETKQEPIKQVEPPKYQPPSSIDKSRLEKTAEFLASNPRALEMMTELLIERGAVEAADDGLGKLADVEAIARGALIENAKFKAAMKYGLSEDDLAILSGTPEEILAKAEYLAKRVAKQEAEKQGDDTTPTKQPPVTLPKYKDSKVESDLDQIMGNVGVHNITPAMREAYEGLKEALAEGPPKVKGFDIA